MARTLLLLWRPFWGVLLFGTVQLNAISTDDVHSGFKESRTIWPRVLEFEVQGPGGRFRRETKELLSTKNENGPGHVSRLRLELPLDSENHLVDLELNTDLIPQGYFERTQNTNLEPVINRPKNHETDLCHYRGKIRGVPNSWAALSTCDGLRGVVFDGRELHYLEPPSRSYAKTQTNVPLNWETIHLKDAHRLEKFSCGHHHSSESSGHYSELMQRLAVTPRRFKRNTGPLNGIGEPYNSGVKSRYVEMVIVVDKKKYQDLGSDLGKVILRTKDIANIVNALYVPLDIYVALVGVVVWTERDAFNISIKGDDTLSSFLLYRRERLLKDHPNDNAQLLTGREFEDGVVGKAMQGPICSYKYSGGVNSDHKSVVGVVATTIAHELGHNFGLSHDTESCKCDGPDSKCIMSASSTSNRTAHWSSCSLESMKYALDHGMDYCLKNKPRSLFEPSTCGNGFVEVGEECDCGNPDRCTNYCCNPHTCKRHSNATCAAGTCCDTSTCQLRSGGTVCRPDQSQCDLPEYCNGESEFCPGDIFMQDGLDCETKNGKAHCAGGECRTHTDQCQLLWGPTGKTSGDICYQKNVNGSRYGHCGYDLVTQKFAICARADIKCGILQCEHHHEKLEYGYEQVAQLSSFFVNVGGGTIHPCRSVTTDFGLDVVDPGLVPDGAICGAEKMCMNQKCVPVDSVLGPLRCPNDCSGNGVCNNKGHCHCKYGHGGDNCDSGGYGGSVDSGPISNPHGGHSVFARALYVTFLGFIPLVGVISFYLYHAGDNFKKLFKRGQTTVSRTQHRDKPNQNGNAGGSKGREANPGRGNSVNAANNDENVAPPNGVIGPDLFGQYKGFSLSPIRHAPSTASATHINNNFQTTSNQNIQNVELPPLPPIPTETEILVKNEKSFLAKAMGRGVSWREPVASSTIISPDQDDVISNTSDTPLTNQKSPTPKVRPLSSPDALNDTKLFNPTQGTAPPKKFFGSTSALSRIAAAFPFVRGFSSEPPENQSPKTSNSSLTRQRSFNRDTLEISRPILQNLTEVKLQGSLVPVRSPKGDVDEVDSPTVKKTAVHRYENVPQPQSRSSPTPARHYANPVHDEPNSSPRLGVKLKPVQKSVDRVKNHAPIVPPPPPLATTNSPPKVQRAHSMIQPNRNSVVGPNYNSLRRSRPTGPPPKPPPATDSVVTLAPIHPPPPLVTTLPLKPNSILKFSGTISKAPIAKMDDSDIGSPMSSGSTPSPQKGVVTKPENIYDVIDESEVPERLETLSTGSSDGGGNGNGLLSDIISEIEFRNKESIYNSVDRRKKKREKLKVLGTTTEENQAAPSSPRITVNPNFQQSSPQLMRKSPKFQRSPSAAQKTPDAKVDTVPEPVTRELSPNIGLKPTCAVNGIPKSPTPTTTTMATASSTSPSYVAKINYFSTLGGNAGKGGSDGTGMKPISSLSQALITAAAEKEKEPIYGPGQLSTIRPTWSRKSSIGKGEGGIYSKPVAVPTPQVPTVRSRSSSPVIVAEATGETTGPLLKAAGESDGKPGYKSFNAYLNRPLTFSTFRPSTKLADGADDEVVNHNGNKCSSTAVRTSSLLNKNRTVGLLTSPVQMRSPARLVTS